MRGIIQVIAKNPVESILVIISLGLLIYGLYLLSPIYVPNYSSPLSALSTRVAEYALGAAWVGASVPCLIFPLTNNKNDTLMLGSLFLFLSFFFLFFLRVLVIGWFPLTWLPLLTISLIAGVLRLYLKVSRR